MPRIPQYEQQTTPSGVANPSTLDTGGRAITVGLGVLASNLRQTGQNLVYVQEVKRKKEVADSLVTTNLELSKAPAKFDAYTIEGQQAKAGNPDGFTGDGLKGFDEYSASVIANATTEEAKQFAQLHLAEMRGHYQTQWMNWEANQGIKVRGTKLDEAGENMLKGLASDPSKRDALVQQYGVVASQAGLPQDDREKKYTDFKDKSAKIAVIGLIDKNPNKALELLKKGKESGNSAVADLSEEMRLQLESHAEAAVEHQRVKAEQAADRSIANTLVGSIRPMVMSMPVNSAGMIDLEAAKAQARAKFGNLGAEQLLRIEGYVESVARDREVGVQRQQQSNYASGLDTLDANGGDLEALKVMRPDVIAGVGRDGLQKLNQYAVTVATGGTRLTDSVAYAQLINNPDLLMSTNLGSMRDKFNEADYRDLTKLQETIRQDPGAEQNVRDTSVLLKERLEAAGVSKKNEEVQGRFYSMLQTSVNEELAATGKKRLTQARTLELADKLLVDSVTNKGVLWDSHGPAFMIEVPDSERAKITLSLMAAGMPATEYNITRAYREKLNKGAQ